MSLIFEPDQLFRVFLALFVVMSPFASLSAFLKLTKHMHWKDRAHAARKAVIVALAVLILTTVLGPSVLSLMGISLKSFQIAGGVMLLLISAQFVLGFSFSKEEPEKVDVAIVLIAVPLITGPGAVTTALLLASADGLTVVIFGAMLASLATWLVLRFAVQVHRLIGPQGEEIMTRLMGLLLGSIAIEFVRKGWGA